MQALLLGSGDAFGIPRAGCLCPQCVEARADMSHARRRSGLLLRTAQGTVLVDASPDILQQLDRVGLAPGAVDRVVISHRHGDHCLGIRDLAYTRDPALGPLPVHATTDTQAMLTAVFASILRPERPYLRFEPWGAGTRVEHAGFTLEGFETHHNAAIQTVSPCITAQVDGVVRRIAYATDMGVVVPSARERLQALDLFVGDGTYLGGPGYGHPGTDGTIAIARALGARLIALTHVGHWGVDAAHARAAVADDVVICRDGDDLCSLLA
ncbi:MAG: MBL fold metallo-hydrolase [Planctomycetota bacterium]|nr:MBL fold metallo-hydrolase [Planctomycetota bacterium]